MAVKLSTLINNKWFNGKGAKFSSLDPATGKTLWTGNESTSSQVNDAVKAARGAWQDWASMGWERRGKYINRFKDLVQENRQLCFRSYLELSPKCIQLLVLRRKIPEVVKTAFADGDHCRMRG